MTVAATVDSRNRSVNDTATGNFTADGTATTLPIGFVPSRLVVLNETDGVRWERMKGMAAANSMKWTAAADMAIDTGTAIAFNSNGTVTLSSGLCVNAKKIIWFAER